ncbi:DUF4136 domain-containing protein [Dyadobacter psychrotolerans]|uniref:DUF4136 domain-containing protein n=1 Tax=Dyadobacter psychrotolerans TaxID=2541721 RepID=A0A4R5DEP5_9BACT|nr:DUF4136 domain-containing protein [Dyadobacter psychrotolerans]TDE11597.1 DUF4136 domain-containing protein [Dyadobacter psychrotolerans]
MKTKILILFALGCLFLSCSSSYKTLKSEQEENFRLSDYSTFGFYDIEAQGDTNSKNFEKNIGLIKQAIALNLRQKGLNEAQDPEIRINIAILVKEEEQTRQTDFRTDGLPRYMGQRRYSWKSEEVVVGTYREGTMLIDFVDAASNKMVWKGGSKGVLSQSGKDFSEKINQAVSEIFAKI